MPKSQGFQGGTQFAEGLASPTVSQFFYLNETQGTFTYA
jgi:hypothetical protein